MRMFKGFSLVVLLGTCVSLSWSYKVDTKPKQGSGQVSFKEEHSADVKAKEHFNPGHPQHGGWHKPEEQVRLEASVSDNQWHAGDSSAYSGQDVSQVSRQSDSHGGSYSPGQTLGFSSSGLADSYSGGGLNHGGDLIVGQGSVQRPANSGNQYHSGTYAQGVGSFPVQAHISPGASQFSQVISSGSKKPSYSVGDSLEYASQQAGGANAYRPVSNKPQYPQKHGSFGGQAHASSPVGSHIPSHPAQGRPPVFHAPSGGKPGSSYKPKPEGQYIQGGHRFPGPQGPYSNSGLRKSPPPGTKFLSTGPQPVHHFAQPQTSTGLKYFH